MGGFCTTTTGANISLPASGKTLTGTDIPQWVSEAAKRLFQEASGLASSKFPQYQGARIAQYSDSKLTPEELRGQQMLGTDYGSKYLEDAANEARQLGQGYGRSTREQLLGLSAPSFTSPMEMPPNVGRPMVDPIEFGTGGEPIPPQPFVDPVEPMRPPFVDPTDQTPLYQPPRPTGPTRTDYTGATRSELLGDTD